MGQLAAALQQINARLDSQAQQQTQQTRAATRATLPAEIEEAAAPKTGCPRTRT
jgi:hypothetical protein